MISLPVFCQITGREIAPDTCREVQRSHDPAACFGCGAHSRLCMACRAWKPVCPELGVCATDLGAKLREEEVVSRRVLTKASGTHLCPIVDKPTAAPMCLATQGQRACQGCASPFRLCESCKKRRVFFPAYGLCLRCAVEKWAPSLSRHSLTRLQELNAFLCDPEELQGNALSRARDTVISWGWASVPLLQRELRISSRAAEIFLEELESEGIVGPRRSSARGGGREVLAHRQEQSSKVHPTAERCSECGINPVQAVYCQRRLCVRCARLLYPAVWTRGLGNSPYLEVALAVLYEEAKKLTLTRATITRKDLIQLLRIGKTAAARVIKHLEQTEVIGPCRRPFAGHEVIARDIAPPRSRRPSREAHTSSHRECCSHCGRPTSLPLLPMRQRMYCLRCVRTLFGKKWVNGLKAGNTLKLLAIRDELFLEAKEFVIQKSWVTLHDLSEHLLVRKEMARTIMQRLERERIVAPYRDNEHRVQGHMVLRFDNEGTPGITEKLQRWATLILAAHTRSKTGLGPRERLRLIEGLAKSFHGTKLQIFFDTLVSDLRGSLKNA